jgi:hypothetical protein
MPCAIYDLTGSYRPAFLNSIAWNLLDKSIAFRLLLGRLRPRWPDQARLFLRPLSGAEPIEQSFGQDRT